MSQYRVVFDAAEAGYHTWWFGLAGVIFIAIGIGLVRFGDRIGFRRTVIPPRVLGWIFVVFASLWTLAASCTLYAEYAGLRRALRDNTYVVVEGVVREFVPGGSDGHPAESFVVNARRYEYSPYIVTSGFSQIQPRGGPIREGLRVRIADVDGTIARLEIAR